MLCRCGGVERSTKVEVLYSYDTSISRQSSVLINEALLHCNFDTSRWHYNSNTVPVWFIHPWVRLERQHCQVTQLLFPPPIVNARTHQQKRQHSAGSSTHPGKLQLVMSVQCVPRTWYYFGISHDVALARTYRRGDEDEFGSLLLSFVCLVLLRPVHHMERGRLLLVDELLLAPLSITTRSSILVPVAYQISDINWYQIPYQMLRKYWSIKYQFKKEEKN